MALNIGIGNFSQSRRTSAGRKTVHGTSLGWNRTDVCGLVVLPIILFTYKRINARRDAVMREAGEKGGLQYSDHELRRMGDRAPDSRYTP